MLTNIELNARREPCCVSVSTVKKHFVVGPWFVRRTLRRHEWQATSDGALLVPPTTHVQRWKNDIAIRRYLRENTDIPVPRSGCAFEDDGAFYLLTEYIEGVVMSRLKRDQKKVVAEELERHMATLKALESEVPGIPGEPLMCPPQRVNRNQWRQDSCWRPRRRRGGYVFCHNDLGQDNVIVDPETLEIKAIVDWGAGGFWPEWYERSFWQRPGASVVLQGEEDDTERCRQWLTEHCEEVAIDHLPDHGRACDESSGDASE